MRLLFMIFTEALKFKRMSLGSKYDEINYFYMLLNAFINTHKATNTETKNHNERVMKKVVQRCNDYFDLYKKKLQQEKCKKWRKKGLDYNQFEVIDNGNQEPKSTKKEETEGKKTDEIQKPLWIKLNKNHFDSLRQDVYNNQNNSEFKTTIGGNVYDLRNTKKFLLQITTKKIVKSRHLNCILI